mgnify:CR=1 FL=1
MSANTEESSQSASNGAKGARVWDLPVRLFHWVLLAAVGTATATGLTGGLWQMDLHVVAGTTVVGLVLFRVIWGLVGGRYARFAGFLKGPGAVIRYALGLARGRLEHSVGHNPMGGWSVMLLLTALAVQAGTGLFANDDIFLEGPLFKYAGKELSDRLTGIHHFTINVIYVLVAAHVAAILLHAIKGDNLVRPMVTGVKPDVDAAASDGPTRWGRVLVALIVAGAPVAWILWQW